MSFNKAIMQFRCFDKITEIDINHLYKIFYPSNIKLKKWKNLQHINDLLSCKKLLL